MTVQEELVEAKSLMRRSLRDIFSEYEGPALLERQKEYRKENPEKYKAYARRRYHDEKAERLVVYP